MSNFDDDMFNEDEYADDTRNSTQQQEEENQEDAPKDLTTELLKIRGIEDSSKIKFEDETGVTIERAWDDLSDNEKLNILAGEPSPEVDEDQQLDEDEIQLINAIRNSGMNVQQYMNNIAPVQAPQAYNQENLSDDELYALNILQTVGSDNITDEELEQAIARAKENEDLYKRTVAGLRQQYQQLQKMNRVDWNKNNMLNSKNSIMLLPMWQIIIFRTLAISQDKKLNLIMMKSNSCEIIC